MNKLRCILFGTIVAISSSTLAFAGDMQTPARTDPPPPPPAPENQVSTEGLAQPIWADEIQIMLQDLATKMFSEVLLTLY